MSPSPHSRLGRGLRCSVLRSLVRVWGGGRKERGALPCRGARAPGGEEGPGEGGGLPGVLQESSRSGGGEAAPWPYAQGTPFCLMQKVVLVSGRAQIPGTDPQGPLLWGSLFSRIRPGGVA